MFQKIAKHRANDASNDVHRPPLDGKDVCIRKNNKDLCKWWWTDKFWNRTHIQIKCYVFHIFIKKEQCCHDCKMHFLTLNPVRQTKGQRMAVDLVKFWTYTRVHVVTRIQQEWSCLAYDVMLAPTLLVVRQTKGQRLPIDLLGRFTPSVQLLFVCAHTQLRSVRINYRVTWFQRFVYLGLIVRPQSGKCINFSLTP